VKNLLVCALLALVPLSSLRMVCLDAHRTEARLRPSIAAAAEEDADAEDECTRVCMRRPAAAPRPAPVPDREPAAAVTCVLVPDPACDYLATTSAALVPPQVALTVHRVSSRFDPAGATLYVAPLLGRRAPPPRA
jgi:hypothetical protein